MAKSRSRKKKKGEGVNWGAVWAVSVRVLAVGFLIALGLGLTLGIDKMRARASVLLAVEEGGPEATSVTFNWPPLAGGSGGTWLPQDDQEELISVVRREASRRDPLTSSRVRSVSAQLGSTGWFVGEPVVRVSGPNAVTVDAEWRTPMAVVRWSFPGTDVPHDVLISDEAMRMPPQWRVPADRPDGVSGRPVIFGCAEPPAGDTPLTSTFGSPWPGPDIRAGLDLIGVLISAELIDHVVGVDVGAHWRGGPLEIVAKGSSSRLGGRIVWGSAPSEWRSGEPSVEKRLQNLHGVIARTGRIDAGERRIFVNTDFVEINNMGGSD